ncbi:mechanosensitive ion channel family protein [Halobacterium yunchengense]|uniref:mechanosensitive ion channel family protein n=1 Tax=Halobacterium yunchengense TaxID=3108497 RepID=UPI00300B7558
MFAQYLILQGQVSDAVDQTLADVVAYLPTLVAAVVILFVGYVVGRLLGSLVTRVVRRIGMSRYTAGTAVESVGDHDTIASALGTLVSYYVYFVALVAAVDVLDIDLLTELLADLAAYVPVILGAIVVLVVGFVVARIVGDAVTGVVSGFRVGPYLRGTPLERFGDETGEFGRLVGTLVTYYVYLLTLLAVADILAVDAFSAFMTEVVGYLPALVGGLLVLVVGVWVAERVGGLVRESGEGTVVGVAAAFAKLFVYYLAITVALSTVGVSVAPLTTMFTAFVVAFFGALALALAIGVGVAVGLGGQEFVRENVDEWAAGVGDLTATEDATEGGAEGADRD